MECVEEVLRGGCVGGEVEEVLGGVCCGEVEGVSVERWRCVGG